MLKSDIEVKLGSINITTVKGGAEVFVSNGRGEYPFLIDQSELSILAETFAFLNKELVK